jgi:hypothetical protein
MKEATTKVTANPGFAAGVVGAVILLQLALVRLLATADVNHVSLLGHELHWGCWFKQLFGIPCPACGMTRSVILTLHGQLKPAFQMNAAGPVGVLGLILFSVMMLFLMVRQQSRTGQGLQTIERQLKLWAPIYGGMLVMILFAHWIIKLSSL